MARDPLNDKDLTCYGCAFGAADAPPPGVPVEWACLTCARNPEVRANGVNPQRAAVMRERGQQKIPSDRYVAVDILVELRSVNAAERELVERLTDRADELQLPADLREALLALRVARKLTGR